jgi:hypothetical protein
MSAQAKHPSASRRGAAGVCPHCGQLLFTQRAVRRLQRTDLEFERKLEAALRAAFAELAGDLASEPEQEEVPEPEPAAPHAGKVTESRELPLYFRQF